jgi:hypothetical protein
MLMIIALTILPIQTSFEEIFTRGYLLQRIGFSTRPWVAVILTAVFFGLLHATNPEVREFGLGIMMLYYISVGVFLALITVLTDGLELALGIHAATNIYGAGFVTYAGSALHTDALVHVSNVNPVWMVVLFYSSVVLFIIIIRKFYTFRPLSSLAEGTRRDVSPEASVLNGNLS